MQIGIKKEVYDRLKKFRDDNKLISFTIAVQTLLNFYEEKEAEVSAFINTQIGGLKVALDNYKKELLDSLKSKLREEAGKIARQVVEDYLEKRKVEG